MPRSTLVAPLAAALLAIVAPAGASTLERLPDGSDVRAWFGLGDADRTRDVRGVEVAATDSLAAAVAAASSATAAPSLALQEAEAEAEPTESFAESLRRARRFGYYFRAGGLVVEQQNQGAVIETGQPIDFEVGGGLSLAFGYRFAGAPLSIEAEYAYRTVDAEGIGFIGDGDVDIHAFTLNLLFDMPQIIGPVGAYAGAGAGFTLDRFAFSSSGTGGTTVAISGSNFFWQAKAGVLVNFSETFQLYGGVVWSDAGTLDNGVSRVSAEMLGIEFGLRIFLY